MTDQAHNTELPMPTPLSGPTPAPVPPPDPTAPAPVVAPVVPMQAVAQPMPLILEQERARCVFFGDPGVGKSTLAGMFPKPLFIDVDAGMVSVAIAGLGAERFEPTSYRDLEHLYRIVRDHGDPYETIVIDSFTELQRLLLDEIVDEEGAAKNETRATYKFVPEQREYLANQRQLHRILHGFRRLGKHIVLTAGVRMRDGQRTPACSPGLLEIVNHWASIIAELLVWTGADGTPERYLVFQPSAARMAKSRFWALGSHMVVPEMRLPDGSPNPGWYNPFDAIWKGMLHSAASSSTHDTATIPPTKENLAAQQGGGSS